MRGKLLGFLNLQKGALEWVSYWWFCMVVSIVILRDSCDLKHLSLIPCFNGLDEELYE